MASIEIVPFKEIDISAYESLLDKCAAPVYAYPWYLSALSVSPSLLVLDNYKAAMPLYIKKKAGVPYLPMPLFVQQWGFFALDLIGDEDIKSVADRLKQRFRLIETNLCCNKDSDRLALHFNSTERINYELNLNKPYEDIVKGFNDQTKRNLKTALKSGNVVDSNVSPNQLMELFKEFTLEKISGLKPRYFNNLIDFMQKLNASGKGRVIGVRGNNGSLLAAGFFVIAPGRIINLFPASHPQGREHQSMAQLLCHVFNQYAGTEMIFDFEGSMIVNVARFYKGFGAMPKPYWHIRYSNLPWWVRLLRK